MIMYFHLYASTRVLIDLTIGGKRIGESYRHIAMSMLVLLDSSAAILSSMVIGTSSNSTNPVVLLEPRRYRVSKVTAATHAGVSHKKRNANPAVMPTKCTSESVIGRLGHWVALEHEILQARQKAQHLKVLALHDQVLLEIEMLQSVTLL
jgi:hypothetical protein